MAFIRKMKNFRQKLRCRLPIFHMTPGLINLEFLRQSLKK
nr:MAG TPA: hypothetical protein [Caudoviricetes sp.]